MGAAFSPSPTPEDEEKVREANRRFYLALEGLDLERMDRVWLHDDSVKCVHPGWELLSGWEEVRESWARIFENTGRMQVIISNVEVQMLGDVAWVVCNEKITSTTDKGFDTALIQATNIFVRRGENWLMIHHHASPIPVTEPTTVQ
ncbi:MAG TPA: nuclear transport factor 2 family protein [Candidatus Acidoferrales bacterium]